MHSARAEAGQGVGDGVVDVLDRGLESAVEGHLERPRLGRGTQLVGAGLRELEDRDGGVPGDACPEDVLAGGEDRTDGTGRPGVGRASARAAATRGVVVVPLQPGDLAVHLGCVGRREGGAAVGVCTGNRRHGAADGCMRRAIAGPVVGDRHLTGADAGDRAGSVDLQPVAQLVGVDRAGHRERADRAARRATGVGHVARVARGHHGEHAVRGELVDHRVLGVVGGGVGPTEGEVEDVEVVGEVAVTVGVEGPVQGRDHRVGGPLAAEHLQAVERRGRGHARADLHVQQPGLGQVRRSSR